MKSNFFNLTCATLLLTTVNIFHATAQTDPKDFLPKVSLPSPDAAAFAKYGNTPVNYQTGVPSISIALHTIKSGQLSLPISLGYHAGGFRVNEIAGATGLGWTLNAGSVISRVIKMFPDESGGGILSDGQGALAGVAGNPANAMQMDAALGTNSLGAMVGVANAVTTGANNLISGNGIQRGTTIRRIGGAIIGSKGLGAGISSLKGALSTASTGRVFRSGGNLAKTAAANFAKATRGNTLEITFTGKAMNSVSPSLPRSITSPIWASLSKNFANGASRGVNFFTTPAGPRAGSIWSTIEKPILEQRKIPITTNITQ